MVYIALLIPHYLSVIFISKIRDVILKHEYLTIWLNSINLCLINTIKFLSLYTIH